MPQEDETEDNLKDGGQHAGAAVGKIGLRLEGENELRDTAEEGKTANHPGSGKQGRSRICNAHDAQDDEENASDGQPDFGTCLNHD